MLKWGLLLSVSLLVCALEMFPKVYELASREAVVYYQTDRSNILIVPGMFTLLYILLTPVLLPFFRAYYVIIMQVAISLAGISCIGQYLSN